MVYKIFSYASTKVINYLKGSLRGLKIDKSVFILTNMIKYTSYIILKATEIISRRLNIKLSFNTPKSAWSYDIIPEVTAYNSDQYVSHF